MRATVDNHFRARTTRVKDHMHARSLHRILVDRDRVYLHAGSPKVARVLTATSPIILPILALTPLDSPNGPSRAIAANARAGMDHIEEPAAQKSEIRLMRIGMARNSFAAQYTMLR